MSTYINRIDFGEVRTILVGTEEKSFTVHPNILIQTSTFFNSALSKDSCWREAQEKTIRLPEHDATTFSIYLNWLYSGFVDLWDGNEIITGAGNQDLLYDRLISCYALGGYVGDDHFCNALIDSYFDLRNMFKAWPNTRICNRAYRELPENSKITLLILHHIAFVASESSLKSVIGELDSSLVKDIAVVGIEQMRRPGTGRTPWERGTKFYYIAEKEAQN